ncbi:MAG: hypothetical protein CL512_04140 [Actinobacteria bacterium]|nr:hypothetical protein [Actinomycetota bacterium]
MCGLFGVFTKEGQHLHPNHINQLVKLGKLAQRRGIDASGLIALNGADGINIVKANSGFRSLANSAEGRQLIKKTKRIDSYGMFGHTRLETHGYSGSSINNQPIIFGDWVVVQNGIITNAENIIESEEVDTGEIENDTIAIAVLLTKWTQSKRLSDLENIFSQLQGEYSIIAASIYGEVLLRTNVGNLYTTEAPDGHIQVASEPRQFNKDLKDRCQRVPLNKTVFLRSPSMEESVLSVSCKEVLRETSGMEGAQGLHLSLGEIDTKLVKRMEKVADLASDRASRLKRCTKCILPETFPGLTFDAEGICSICSVFSTPIYRGIDQFAKDLSSMTPENKNVLTCLSGGRDSCYILHLVKELGFSPIAYTYDWGMVTTTARENMSRMCAKLEVEHVLVSPDIRKNRQRINRALRGWLVKPEIATIPILMAGDKPYFRWAKTIARERGEIPAILADHPLETTGFKAILAGATPTSDPEGGVDYRLSNTDLLRMAATYGLHAMRSPQLIPSLATEGLIGFVDYYLRSHNFIRPFAYFEWEEDVIEDTLMSLYDWSAGTNYSSAAWRMGDGTAPFYNLMYLIGLGMTEHDTMRANQIRYGMITRSEALSKVKEDNKLNILGLVSYFETVGIDSSWAGNCIEKFTSKELAI